MPTKADLAKIFNTIYIMSYYDKYLKYKNKYLALKNQYGGANINIGDKEYEINKEYYIAGELGNNPNNYPRITDFSSAEISTTTGLSAKYPDYHFKFWLIDSKSVSSGFASTYKLKITKINDITEFKKIVEREKLVISKNMISLESMYEGFWIQVRFEKWENPTLIFGVIYYSNPANGANYDVKWVNTNNYVMEMRHNTNLSDMDKEIIKIAAKRVASVSEVNIDIKSVFNNLFT